MKRKILTFVVKDRKFLALEMTKHPEHAPQGGWFVVTGGIEKDESPEDTVAREVFEETGLNIEESIFLNWSSIYEWRDEYAKKRTLSLLLIMERLS